MVIRQRKWKKDQWYDGVITNGQMAERMADRGFCMDLIMHITGMKAHQVQYVLRCSKRKLSDYRSGKSDHGRTLLDMLTKNKRRRKAS